MGKDFIKFMVLVVILYLGFLATFSLLARDRFPLPAMALIVTKIFFGSSYVGFDIMDQINPVFGPPLMIIFITLSSILLMGSLTGMLSNSFSRVISHAREEYLFVYSVYVLEASTSNQVTHFYPPFNLLALIIFRPLRLFVPSGNKFRAARIALLKATHLPIVGAILFYELIRGKTNHKDEYAGFKDPKPNTHTSMPKKRNQEPLNAGPSSSYQRGISQRPSAPPAQPKSSLGGNGANSGGMAGEDDMMDESTYIDVRISELSSKIDKLTELVAALQAQNTKT
jgi:hypothetical protein